MQMLHHNEYQWLIKFAEWLPHWFSEKKMRNIILEEI
jgi:hypothetical protein